jgi:hypothetical protein
MCSRALVRPICVKSAGLPSTCPKLAWSCQENDCVTKFWNIRWRSFPVTSSYCYANLCKCSHFYNTKKIQKIHGTTHTKNLSLRKILCNQILILLHTISVLQIIDVHFMKIACGESHVGVAIFNCKLSYI